MSGIDTSGLNQSQIAELASAAERMRREAVLDREQRIASDRNGFRELWERYARLKGRHRDLIATTWESPYEVTVGGCLYHKGTAEIRIGLVPEKLHLFRQFVAYMADEDNSLDPFYTLSAFDPDGSGYALSCAVEDEGFDLPQIRQRFMDLVFDVEKWVHDAGGSIFQLTDFED